MATMAAAPLGHFLQGFQVGLAGDAGIGAVQAQRNGAVDDQQVLALVVLHGLVQGFLGLVAGGGHQGFLIVQRNGVEDQPSMVGEWERVMDSVQPVHSWNGSQITEGRLVAAGAAAIASAMAGPRTAAAPSGTPTWRST
jgi:hypothetical protein